MNSLTLKHFKNVFSSEHCKTILEYVCAVPKGNVVNIKNEYGDVPNEKWYGINVIPNRFRFQKNKFDFLSDSINNNTPYNYNDWALDMVYVNSYFEGDECLRHVDLNTKGRQDSVAKGTDYYTAIILLNDNYKGGVLKAGNRDMPIDMEVGDMVIFNGRSTSHLVTEITEGERHTLVIWGKYI
jgi:hypothetical protein|tara:strand:+ start:780 stop:1328 length:549 start_codon:yes stop_codon:yes gene_type:complete